MSRVLNHVAVCFVCRRRSDGYAIGPSPKTLGWYCMACFPIAKRRSR